MTNGQFIALFLSTKIEEAKEWIDKWKESTPAKRCKWNNYANLPLTSGSVLFFATGIQLQISNQISTISDEEIREQVSEKGHAFLREIHRKATENGIDVEIKTIDSFPE
jgi:hypothetical protein